MNALLLICAFSLAFLPVFSPVSAITHDISIEMIVPTEAVYGHQEISITVNIESEFSDAQFFDVEIWHGGDAWGREDGIYSVNIGEIYNTIGADNYVHHFWRGTVGPRQKATFTLTTYSWVFKGTYDNFAGVTITGNPEPSISKSITLTQGSGDVHAEIEFGNNQWKPGESREVWLTMHSPTLFQFVGNMSSDCDVLGLPFAFTGHPQRTVEKFMWYLSLSEDIDEGSNCTITAQYWNWSQPSIKYYEEKSFQVPYQLKPNYFPIIVN